MGVCALCTRHAFGHQRRFLLCVAASGARCGDAHTVETASAAASLRLSVDVPSAATGTGEALLLDGQDTGLLRAEVLDARGVRVPHASNNVISTGGKRPPYSPA